MAWTPKWIRNYVLSSRVLHTRTVLLIATVTSDVTQRLYHYVIHKLTALCDNLDLTSYCHWSDVPRGTRPGVITVKVHFMWIKWSHLLFEAFLWKKVLLLVESSILYALSKSHFNCFETAFRKSEAEEKEGNKKSQLTSNRSSCKLCTPILPLMLAEITWSPHTSREGRGSLGPAK